MSELSDAMLALFKRSDPRVVAYRDGFRDGVDQTLKHLETRGDLSVEKFIELVRVSLAEASEVRS